MAEILGEALALQSNFKPDTQPILTKSLMRADEMDMKKAIAKQKAEEAKQKRLDDLYSKIKPIGEELNPYYADEGKKLFANYISGSMDAMKRGDYQTAKQIEQDAILRGKTLSEQSKQMDAFINADKSGFIVPKELKDLRAMPREKALVKFRELVKERPELQVLATENEQGDLSLTAVKDIKVDDEIGQVLRNNQRLFTEKVGSKSIDANTNMFIYKIPKDKVKEMALDLSSSPEMQANIIYKDHKGYSDVYDRLIKDNPNMNPLEAKQRAVSMILENKIERLNQSQRESSLPSKGGLELNFNRTPLYLDDAGMPGTDKINVNVTTKDGKRTRQIAVGNFYGFKAVEILNTQTNDVIDIGNNEPVKLPDGNTFDMIKVGKTVAMPIAQKDFTTKSGVSYKRGQLVDEKAVRGLTQNGLVRYEPRVEGQVSYKVGGGNSSYTVTKSVVIPAKNIRRAVEISSGSTDQKQTALSFDYAEQEAQELNDALYKRKKISGQPTQPSSKPKLSFPEWKKQNPNGTAADYKKYKG